MSSKATALFGYSRGEIVSRAKVKAGEHFLRASFPELADLKDPLENINPDMRRGLFVDYLEIVGPYRSEHRASRRATGRFSFAGAQPGEQTRHAPEKSFRT